MVAHAVGIMTGYPNPLLVDLVRDSQMAFLWLDAEHTGLQPRDCSEVGARLAGCVTQVLVRVPNGDPDTLLAFANAGADEIVLPRVRSLAEVERALEVISYPPNGRRPRQVTPASGYGKDWGTCPALSIVIETVEAADGLEQFADSPSILGLWMGPRDLEDDMREKGRGGSGDMGAVLDDLIARAGGRHAAIGLGVAEPAAIPLAFDRGAARCALFWEPFLRERVSEVVRAGRQSGASR
jgi:2-keto-3-deoxy-L-rhamnonate aldolase RhmA